MPEYFLGVSCFFHDSAACLVSEGKIIAAAQEERFSRIKHDPAFPKLAINFCLEEAKISDSDLTAVIFYEDTKLVLDRVLSTSKTSSNEIRNKQINELFKFWPSSKLLPQEVIRKHLPDFSGEIFYSQHHQSHAAAAFMPSPFSEAAILTIDGVGEYSTASISKGTQNGIELIKTLDFPNSVGLLYSAATHFLGFKVNSGEYKVMGLAPYGEPRFLNEIRSQIVTLHEDGSIELNMDYFDFSGVNQISTKRWSECFGMPRRSPETELLQFHFDLAASIQSIVEHIMVNMALEAKKLCGSQNLCMSGGVALNCVGNGKIAKLKIFDNLWIQPAAGDAGCAIGAAFLGWQNFNTTDRKLLKNGMDDLMQEARLGPSYSTEEIIDFLELYGFPYLNLAEDKIIQKVTDLILEGKVIGLLQGKMEFGPRALGGRSIIGDARSEEMQRTMNMKIKFRESFRPFAPVVIESEAHKWFELEERSPYMLLVADVAKSKRKEVNSGKGKSIQELLRIKRSDIPAVTHVDYSARVQTVTKNPKNRLRSILDEFFLRTDVPVLVNTSFNVRNEPIVCSPVDAYRCMMRSNIDAILLENILVLRDQQPEWKEDRDWKEDFEND